MQFSCINPTKIALSKGRHEEMFRVVQQTGVYDQSGTKAETQKNQYHKIKVKKKVHNAAAVS